MIAYFKQLVNSLKRPKILLILANILLVFFLILLSNLGVLPVKNSGDFIFFTFLAFAFALYRPGWAFLFFVGTIALENINLAPESIGINIRPYQFIGGLAILATIVRLLTKRLNFSLPKWNWMDGLLVVFAISGFASALGSESAGAAIKQAIVITSFAALYFLVRIFIQSLDDLKRIVPFFLSSSIVVIIYGIWQNIRFMQNLAHFEVMPGRPNSTFTEPDWLGIYLVLVLAIIYAVVYWIRNNNQETITKQISITNFQPCLPAGRLPKSLHLISYILYLAMTYILLTLTVSRSAWLGALIVSLLFVVFSFWHLGLKNKNWKGFFQQLNFLAIAVFFSFGVVYFFHLTNFQLFNRLQSTGTGLQKITVSCQPGLKCALPEVVRTINELENCNCRHINLEEIEQEKIKGNIIKEVYRQDPNVNIRKVIYQKSWAEIKKHPILGIGWGNIGKVLGQDERGVGLNSSNIFLEVWLGAGLAGIIMLVIFLIGSIIKAVKILRSADLAEKIFGLFLILGLVALIIPNLFNAGVFLGIIWLFFGIINYNTSK